MDTSPFGKLPAELRITVYELVLYRQHGFRFTRTRSGKRHRGGGTAVVCSVAAGKPFGHHLALSKVCRQIRDEYTKVFYSINTFTIVPYMYKPAGQWNIMQARHYNTDMTAYKRWVKTIGPNNAAAIKHFVIKSPTWAQKDVDKPSGRWWRKAREIESRMLHRIALPVASTYVCVSVQIVKWPMPHGELPSCSVRQRWLDYEVYGLVTYRLPTKDRTEARENVLRQTEDQAKLLCAHEGHGNCWVAAQLPPILAGLSKAQDAMLKAIGE